VNSTTITTEQIIRYDDHLRAEDRSPGTREKYARDIKKFAAFLGGTELSPANAAAWRTSLIEAKYAPSTINSMIAALNGFLSFIGHGECRLRFLKIQRRLFREKARELDRTEYGRLIETAYSTKKERLALLMETICASGIRVSEVRYITVEAANRGRAEVYLKGKIRSILLPQKLCRKLLKYAKKQKIAAGEIFLTGSGRGLTRGQIWAEMKRLCRAAGVNSSKVFPHNLRHLFAVTFYKVSRDITRLADVLGHSSLETTRIYLITTGHEHERQLEKLGLVT